MIFSGVEISSTAVRCYLDCSYQKHEVDVHFFELSLFVLNRTEEVKAKKMVGVPPHVIRDIRMA